MIARVEETAEVHGIKANIKIIDSMDEMVTYYTWLLPTLVINDQVVARGYVPSMKQIIEHMQP